MPFQKQLEPKREPRYPRSYGEGILRPFEKTPPAIVCPHFWELNWGYGCPLDCAYCYLQGTLRGKKQPRHRKLNRVFKGLRKAFEDGKNGNLPPTIFNSGELADSLMFPPVMEEIVDKFEQQEIHKLLILSKLDNVGFLLKKPRNQTIVSFSLNASEVAERWEKAAPSISRRVDAARRVKEAGYETRIRIDPMVPVKNWEKYYCNLVNQIFDALEPERITLGSLRGLWKTIKFCEDNSWTKYLTESGTGWGKKVGKHKRFQMYGVIKDYLEFEYNYSRIAFCKETPKIWRRLGIDPGTPPEWKGCRCNCVW